MAFKGKSEFAHLEYLLMAATKYDIDQLWFAFRDTDSIRFKSFVDQYNKKEFSTIYLGRFQMSELVEFVEHLFIYASSYMFSQEENEYTRSFVIPGTSNKSLKPKKTRTLQERIFGLYLTYCLYFLQPSKYVVPVRITSTQAENLIPFLKNDLLPEHQDAAFCLFRLIDHNVFTIIPFSEEYNPLIGRLYDFDELNYANFEVEPSEPDIKQDIVTFSNLRTICNDSNLNRLVKLHNMYTEQRSKAGIPPHQQVVQLNVADLFMNQLEECEKTLNEIPVENENKIAKHTRAGIRSKAYGDRIVQRRDRRHRHEFSELDGLHNSHNLSDYVSPKKRHGRLDMDPLQEQIWKEVTAEQRKTERFRRETLTESINEEDLLEKEVEKDISRGRKKGKIESPKKPTMQTRRMQMLENQKPGPSTEFQTDKIPEESPVLKQKLPRKIKIKVPSNLRDALSLNVSNKSEETSALARNFPIETHEELATEQEADSIFESLIKN